MICEHCRCENDGKYGSGRFCSSKCARSFATSKDRERINAKVSLKLRNVTLESEEQLQEIIKIRRIPIIKEKIGRSVKNYDENDIFRIGGNSRVAKRLLIKKKGYLCEQCKLSVWLGKPLTLQLDHINGDREDQTYNNLRLLCPNCHSQTDTFGVCKRTNRVISEDRLVSALTISKSIREAILLLKISDSGANYNRLKRVCKKYGLPLIEQTKTILPV